MDRIELSDLLQAKALTASVNVRDLTDRVTNRTLLLADGHFPSMLHVWLDDGKLHRAEYVYGGWRSIHSGTSMYLKFVVPDGPVHPESSDYDFIKLLRSLGGTITDFRKYDEHGEEQYRKIWDPYSYTIPYRPTQGASDERA